MSGPLTPVSHDAKIASIDPVNIKKNEALYVLKLIQDKARELNHVFGKMSWTPRAIDKAVWADR